MIQSSTNHIVNWRHAIVSKVEDEDQNNARKPTLILKECRSYKRVLCLHNIASKHNKQHDGSKQQSPCLVREEQSQQCNSNTKHCKAKLIYLSTNTVLCRQELNKNWQEQNGNCRNQEQILPSNRAKSTSSKNANRSRKLISSSKESKENYLKIVAQILSCNNKEGRTCYLLASGL